MSYFSNYHNPLSVISDSDEENNKEATPVQHLVLLQNEKMSSQSSNPLPLIMMRDLIKQFNQMHAKVAAIWDKNQELCEQPKAEKSPSPTTSEEKDQDIKSPIKVLSTKEKKGNIPKPHK